MPGEKVSFYRAAHGEKIVGNYILFTKNGLYTVITYYNNTPVA